MCGRYSFASSTELLKDAFDLQHMELFQSPRYNIAPGQFIMAIVQSDDHRTLTFWKWGLIPFWAKENHASYSSLSPNALMQDIHDRMPVILPPQSEATWLNPTIQDRAILEPLLIPYPADQMRAFPVASVVNNAKNDVSACVEPSSNEQPSFFTEF